MSAERPNFVPQQPAEQPLVFPESFLEALKRERPDNFNWDRIEAAMDVLKGNKIAVAPTPPEPEPTESQKFWRDMYRSGNLTPYQKERQKVTVGQAIGMVKDAFTDPNLHGFEERVLTADLAIRGGSDKEYNQLGDIKHRVKRMGVMVGNTVPFTAFDIVTSIPSSFITEGLDIWLDKQKKASNGKAKKFVEGTWLGVKKVIDVQNDKDVTALGDMMVAKLTGEKGAWTHEAADKSADLVQTGWDEYLRDSINGPTIESIMRFLFQIPIAGAVIEQKWTRLSLWQEQSQLFKGMAKSFYMGIGTAIGVWRDVKSVKKEERKAPSARIARGAWRLVLKLFKINLPPATSASE